MICLGLVDWPALIGHTMIACQIPTAGSGSPRRCIFGAESLAVMVAGIIALSFWLGLEAYVFFSLKGVFSLPGRSRKWWMFLRGLTVFGFLAVLVTVVYFMISGRPVRATLPGNILLGLSFTFFLTKLVFAFVLLIEDVVRGTYFAWRHASRGLKSNGSGAISLASRRSFLSKMGLLIASLPFSAFMYGITKGKYAFHLHKITIAYPDLPEAFDGLRIVQLSDVHSGSFDEMDAVQRGLELVAEQKADLFLFTGDMVNDFAEEVVPYKEMFGKLSAPLGKFSILGNHDYGDYPGWESPEAKEENFVALHQHHKDMGFDLLKNRHVRITRGGQSFVLAGVENWGKPPFPQLGDLDKALDGINPDDFVVLMSHDPTHWDAKVLPGQKQVHLTLSGHTHGAQMGVEIPGVKWSPSQFVYPRWAGLYREGARYLYVNRGFGFIGFPGRVGIWPEVTVLELKRGNQA